MQDLRSDNVIVDVHGAARLADFGATAFVGAHWPRSQRSPGPASPREAAALRGRGTPG